MFKINLPSLPVMSDSDRLADVKTFKSNPKWKKQAELMCKHVGEIREQFNSPEWFTCSSGNEAPEKI